MRIPSLPTSARGLGCPPTTISLVQIDIWHPEMQSVQRQFGKLWNKSPGDNAKVSVLLKDYEDADKALAKVGIPKSRRPLTNS